jgi:hypothetical protein
MIAEIIARQTHHRKMRDYRGRHHNDRLDSKLDDVEIFLGDRETSLQLQKQNGLVL